MPVVSTFRLYLLRAAYLLPGTADSITACVMGVVVSIIVIPWPYFVATYMRAPADRWTRSAKKAYEASLSG
jgi:hypothetical protein